MLSASEVPLSRHGERYSQVGKRQYHQHLMRYRDIAIQELGEPSFEEGDEVGLATSDS